MIDDVKAALNIECSKQEYERYVMLCNKKADTWRWQEITQILTNVLTFKCCNICGNISEKVNCDINNKIEYCDVYCHWQIKNKHIDKSQHWQCKICHYTNKSLHSQKCIICGCANKSFKSWLI